MRHQIYVFVIFALLSRGFQCPASDYTIDPTPYLEHAKLWTENYMYREYKLLISERDLQTLANIAYFSYYRSKITLEAQEASMQALNIFWNNHENIATTRRNPSVIIPHPIDASKQASLACHSIYLSTQHQLIGTIYANLVEASIHGDLLHASLALKGLQALRNDARVVVAQALLDVRALLGTLYYSAQKSTQQLNESVDTQEQGVRSIMGAINFISGYLPHLALQSLVDADNFNNRISSEGWQTFMSIQDISYQTWRMIEQARASFYQAHYQMLYTTMQELHLPTTYFTIMTNEHGVIEPENQVVPLPDPNNL